MKLNIFIPEPSDQSATREYVLPLIREAISEGTFIYPYHIKPNQTEKAAILFTFLFAGCVAAKTFALALDEDTPVGFESYMRSPFCDYFQTPNIYDGLLTFVSKPYRRQGISSQMRKYLLNHGNFQAGDTFRFSVKKDNDAGYLSVDKLAKELTINMVETGVTYEGQLVDKSNI